MWAVPVEERHGAALFRSFAIVAPALALGAAYSVGLVTHLAGRPDAGLSVPAVEGGRYWVSQGEVLLRYLRLAFVPAGQTIDADLHPSASLSDPAALLALAGVGGVVSAAVWFARRGVGALRVACFGIAWFFVALLPTSVLPIADLFAEHRAYLALFGVALAAAVAADALGRRAYPRLGDAAGTAVVMALAVVLGATLAVRATVWHDAERLWRDASEKAPENARARANLAATLLERGRTVEASAAYDEAFRIGMDNPVLRRAVACDFADVLLRLGRIDDAARVIEDELRRGLPDLALLAVLSRVRIGQHAYVEAEAVARKAILLAPAAAVGDSALAFVLQSTGRAMEAEAELAIAVRLMPGAVSIRLDHARSLAALHRMAEACREAAFAEQFGRPGESALAGEILGALSCPRH